MKLYFPLSVIHLFWIIFLLFPLKGKSQKWVADSITVNFGQHPDTKITTLNLSNAYDFSANEPAVISNFEQKKALFFPVDQVVKLSLPLCTELMRKFSSDSISSDHYSVSIHYFNIVPSKTLGKRNFTLYSSIETAKHHEADSIFLGTFYYEQSYMQKAKLPIEEGYEILLDAWMRRLTSDVLTVGSGVDELMGEPLYHFRNGGRAVDKNFYTGAEFFAGLNFWGVDGEIWFSEPEGNPIFNRTIRMVRYVNHPDFQSIAFGNGVRLWNYRISENWLFTHKIAFMMGINNWKDMQTTPHKLEEILLFDLSFTQRISYNRFDQKGLVFGLGFIEDAHYIVYHKPKLKIGLSLNCAYKF
ncbi:MAG: hypothetical protein ACERKD_02625 [Prolixibacteraceae bacterium]